MDDIAQEVAALKAVGDALAPLDPSARKRIIEWADARFGTSSLVDTLSDGLKVLSGGLDAIADSARLHEITPAQMRLIADRIIEEAAMVTIRDSETDPEPRP